VRDPKKAVRFNAPAHCTLISIRIDKAMGRLFICALVLMIDLADH
jgi:hypothetical protein